MRTSNALLALCLSFTLPLISCEKDEEAEKVSLPGGGGTGGGGGGTGGGGGGGGALGTIGGAVVFMGDLDGTAFSYTASASIDVVAGYDGNIDTPPALSSKIYEHDFWDSMTSQLYMGVRLGKLEYLGGVPDDPTFFSFFTTGSRNYGDPDVTANVVEVHMIDGAGTEWSTACDLGAQPGSAFQITDKQEITGLNTAVKVRATLNCTLYSCTSTATKTITNGVWVGYLENL